MKLKVNDVAIVTRDGEDLSLLKSDAWAHNFEVGALVVIDGFRGESYVACGVDKSGDEDYWIVTDECLEKIGEL